VAKITAGVTFRYFAGKTWTCGKGSHMIQYMMGGTGAEGFAVTYKNRHSTSQEIIQA
jgi:hypothetical protein